MMQDSAHFVLCPKQCHKIKVVVLNRVHILGFFFVLNRVRGFKPSAAHLYPNISEILVKYPKEISLQFLQSLSIPCNIIKSSSL